MAETADMVELIWPPLIIIMLKAQRRLSRINWLVPRLPGSTATSLLQPGPEG